MSGTNSSPQVNSQSLQYPRQAWLWCSMQRSQLQPLGMCCTQLSTAAPAAPALGEPGFCRTPLEMMVGLAKAEKLLCGSSPPSKGGRSCAHLEPSGSAQVIGWVASPHGMLCWCRFFKSRKDRSDRRRGRCTYQEILRVQVSQVSLHALLEKGSEIPFYIALDYVIAVLEM